MFVSLFTFKAVKIVVHTYAYYSLPQKYTILLTPTVLPTHVTVIAPTVGALDAEFRECINSILANRPGKIIVATVGSEKLLAAKEVCECLNARHFLRTGQKDIISVVAITEANKRAQFIEAAKVARTHITTYSDDHVFWPPIFLRAALVPFEDPRVDLVGTRKRVRRDRSGGLMASFINYLACIYLERHNFECTASSAIDGGVFVISGRTALAKTSIIHSKEFQHGFLNEIWLLGRVGPMKVDDNFVTRFVVNHGYRTIFLNSPEATTETSLGTKGMGGWEKFRGQLICWVRTTWPSNSTCLFAERDCWSAHPWTTYAMFVSAFFNIDIIYDPELFLSLHLSGNGSWWCSLLFFLFVSKAIKPWSISEQIGVIFAGCCQA